MVRVFLFRDGQGGFIGFRAEGHTGLASSGEDIVCAALSALLQSLVIGLERVIGLECCVRKRHGVLECRLAEPPDGETARQAEVLARTTMLAIEEIRAVHPDRVRVSTSGG